MADIVILCPIAVEFEAVYQLLEDTEEGNGPVLAQDFALGYVSAANHIWKVALVETGSRTEHLGAITARVMYYFQPKYILLVGVAGGIKDVAIGDIVIATKAYGYDSGKESENGFDSRPYVIDHPVEILRICRRLARKYNSQKRSFKVVLGPIASGNKVVAYRDAVTYQIIKQHYNDTIALEMEATGFAEAASGFGVQFANIRGISDLLDNKTKSDKEGSQELASQRAAQFTIDLIRSLPLPAKEVVTAQIHKVTYLDKQAALLSYRRPKKGELKFRQSGIELRTKNGMLELKEIRKVEHIAMHGDFAPNWVMVEFRHGESWSKIFLSTTNPPGLGNWFGGSKRLMEDIEAHLTSGSQK